MFVEAEVEEKVYNLTNLVLERFLESHQGDEFFGVSILVSPFDPSLQINIGCLEPSYLSHIPKYQVSEETLIQDPDFWHYANLECEVLSSDELTDGLAFLDDIVDELEIAGDKEADAIVEKCIACCTRALIRLDQERIFEEHGYARPEDWIVVTEEDVSPVEARMRYREIREAMLQPDMSRDSAE